MRGVRERTGVRGPIGGLEVIASLGGQETEEEGKEAREGVKRADRTWWVPKLGAWEREGLEVSWPLWQYQGSRAVDEKPFLSILQLCHLPPKGGGGVKIRSHVRIHV